MTFALVSAGAARALSCLPHTLEGTLAEVATAEEGYVAAYGRLSFDEALVPRTDWQDQASTPQLSRLKAQFRGKALSRSGFSARMDRSVHLDIQCFGPWCASPPSGKQVLVFLKQTSDGPVAHVTPCGGTVFFDPGADALKLVERCYLDGVCPEPER